MDEIHHSIHIPQWKKDEIEDIKKLIDQYPVVGMVGIHGLPSKQMQQMRSSLRDTVLIKVCKNTLILKALEETGNGSRSLEKYVDQETGLIFSKENSFKLYKLLESSKTPAPIKGGMKAPMDIVVEKGPTSFPPGPIVGELQNAGIPASIDAGKVVIRETKVVAREGEAVPQKLAAMLTRLEIYPLELGLDLRATFENGILFDSTALTIDETMFSQNISIAARQAFNLSVNSAYPTAVTIVPLLTRAFSQSRNLAINAEIFVPGVMDVLLSKGQSQMLALAALVSDEALDDGLRLLVASEKKAPVKEAAVVQDATAKEEKKPEDEKESEETAAEGLGALFG